MLDARTDGKRLGLKGDVLRVELLVEGARRVADREDDGIGDELAARFAADAADTVAVVDEERRDTVVPNVTGAAGFEVRALADQDLRQAVGADVRARVDEDRGIGAGLDEGASARCARRL